MKRVLLIGTIPPPIGGVTMHIQRLFRKNLTENAVDLFVCDLRKGKIFYKNKKLNIFNFFKVFMTTDIVHIQVSNQLKLVFALLARLFFRKVVYTHHNVRVNNQLLFKWLLKMCHRVILVNKKDLDYKLSEKELEKVSVIPAFVAPTVFGKLPDVVTEAVEKKRFALITNSTEDVFINGKLIYGYDLLIEAFSNLVKTEKIKNAVLVMVDPSGQLKKTVEELTAKFCEETTKESLLYFADKLDFTALVKKSSAVIRATRTDGDALTVREALYFQVPVIASDCVERPQNTILFKNENVKDLEEKILDVYKGSSIHAEKTDDYFNELIANYNF